MVIEEIEMCKSPYAYVNKKNLGNRVSYLFRKFILSICLRRASKPLETIGLHVRDVTSKGNVKQTC